MRGSQRSRDRVLPGEPPIGLTPGTTVPAVSKITGLASKVAKARKSTLEASTAAIGSALPTSSQAQTATRRAMKRGSSPPAIILASQ